MRPNIVRTMNKEEKYDYIFGNHPGEYVVNRLDWLDALLSLNVFERKFERERSIWSRQYINTCACLYWSRTNFEVVCR